MVRRRFLSGLILIAAAVSALDAPPVLAQVSRWVAVPAQSSITMRVASPLGHRTGRFERWNADVRFDPEAPEAARVAVTVEAASLRMDNAALTRPAIGPALLDTERFPDIRFRLTSLRRLDGERFTAQADVTMKGVTRPVSFPVTLRSDGRTAQMTGGFSLDRAAYGIGTQGSWNRLIGRQVRVDVSLATRSA
ncbi:YceI family protein [Brevundimonas subvibrioides]|uniref:YceI family protein n=1 Tax=Brevundimonas subvibrioides (strain ATCC 15264 / DSM 4735 / LMG 14903 / NBRC 16000 / CB 81) TaxID=633149 RepID=D9QLI0_BRESC|nr:YceI family protein [Brevundimonas subvibrioides]ADL01874.1 YceI family protein [Brevundimonas subvibrioides ATCC 15264]